MHSKTTLREHFRQLRQQLSLDQQQEAAIKFSDQVILSNLLKKESFACYIAQDGELDMMPLIKKLWENNKSVYIPVISHDYENNILVFKSYTADTVLALNQYQILEPVDSEIISLENIDVIFLPLVAFDSFGTRLGMGGGFYDRTLAGFKHKSKKDRPLFIGAGHACQEAKKLPINNWDVKMQSVMTDTGLVAGGSDELPGF